MAEDESDPKEPKLTEAIKKIVTAGISGVVLSEEMIRSYVSDVKMPKELMQLLLQGASKSKEEITTRVGKEISGLIQKIDLVKEVSKFAETHKFKINAEIEIIPKKKSTSDEEQS